MRFCDGEKAHKARERKTQDPPSKTEGGAPFAWLRAVLTLRFVLADRFSSKEKNHQIAGGHPPWVCHPRCVIYRGLGAEAAEEGG